MDVCFSIILCMDTSPAWFAISGEAYMVGNLQARSAETPWEAYTCCELHVKQGWEKPIRLSDEFLILLKPGLFHSSSIVRAAQSHFAGIHPFW